MRFHPIYYITLVCPSLETSLGKIREYIQNGATALQIDMPSRNPVYETPFVAEMMAKALAEYANYDRFMDELRAVRKAYPHVEIHLVLYPDVIESIGFNRFVSYFLEAGFSSLMLVSTDEALRSALRDAGITLLSSISKDMTEAELAMATSASAEDVIALNYRLHTQSARTQYPTFADKIRFLRERGVCARVFAVEGIATKEMMLEVRDAGADGALVGNVLMRLWNEPDKLWDLFRQFQEVAYA